MALTQAQLDWIEDGKLIIPHITVYDGANTLATIDGANDVVDGSMSFDRNASSGTGFAAGYVEAAEVSFTLFNDTNQFDGITFEGKEISIVLDIAGTNVPYGRYIIDTKPILGRTIEIRALDYVVKLSKPCPVDVSGKTIGTALNDILTSCGITQYSSTFTNSDKVLGEYDDLDNATSHEMVQWLVALTGGIGYMTPEATPRFRIAELDELQTPIQLPQHVVLAETNTGIDEVFSGVVMPIGDADYLVGDETGSVMGFESNPLMTLDMNYQAILNGIGGKVIGAHVTSAPSLSLLGQPFLMPLDKITFRDEFNAPVTTYVLTHAFKLNNGSEISSDWALRATDGYASMSPISPAQRVAIRQAAQQVIQSTQSGWETAMFELNEKMANSLGYYVTAIEQPDGSKITYTHDQPVLADSSYISYQSASGFAFTNDGWNGGSPTWTYGITSDGSLVMRLISTVGLSAEWIKLTADKTVKDAVSEVANSVGDNYAEIQIVNGALQATVSDVNGLKPTVAQVVQDLAGWGVRIQGVEAVSGDNADAVADVVKFMRFDEDFLTIGKSGSPLEVQVTNDAVNFYDGGAKVAWISGQQLFINSAVVTQDLTIGNHRFEKHNNEEITVARWIY